MDQFDEYTICLLEESKRFLEKATSETDEIGKQAYLHSSLLLSICFVEAIVNGLINELTKTDIFSLYEISVLCEKELQLDHGEYKITTRLKMQRLLDKIDIIYYGKTRKKINHASAWWGQLKHGIELRNNLVHPKDVQKLDEKIIAKVILSSIECTDCLFKAIYRKPFPKRNRDLNTSLTF